MRYPKFLPKNGTIGFVAPSFGCASEPYRTAFENAQKIFKEKGYSLDLGPNCYEDQGIGISNTPKACARELEKYYCSSRNDILISCGGGEMMCETIGEVDFQKLKEADPKWFMGYSDNTNLIFLLSPPCAIQQGCMVPVQHLLEWNPGTKVFSMPLAFLPERHSR